MAVRRLLFASVTLLLTAGLVMTGLSAPAQAASGQVSSRSATLFKNCFSHPFRYALSGVGTGWTLTVDLVTAGGRRVDRAVVPASAGASGTGAFRLCAGTVRPGAYTVRSRVTWPADAARAPLALPTTGLTLIRPRSTTALGLSTRRPKLRKHLKITTTVRVARPYGLFTAQGIRVKAQVRHKGRWRTLGKVRVTNAAGIASWRVRWRYAKPKKVRVVTRRSIYQASSTSRVVLVRSKAPKPKR
ncbi:MULTISPECIES: hypothetical protein [Mumia]|uniref:hypothetical protein n=1 Tax=Mumia TaxID=1546255 RepID=UPI001421EC59|nr:MULTISPECIES: hypothetical protein [unclassified Mumia]QMW64832.1 hypothetical protein H4N58_11295 [Mumia sp. ZJ1417]